MKLTGRLVQVSFGSPPNDNNCDSIDDDGYDYLVIKVPRIIGARYSNTTVDVRVNEGSEK